MYTTIRKDIEYLNECSEIDRGNSVFTTNEWVLFLKNNQHAEPLILQILDGAKPVAVFVGMILKKYGIRIVGSPFEGWLTCDMGFIHLGTFDINEALKVVADFAFSRLNCWYVQITDKRIKLEMLSPDIKYYMSKIVYIDNSVDLEDVLASFSKNGRRDVRASMRKGAVVKRVPFDHDFMDEYYRQLLDVFDKQGLKPFYSVQKLYDIVDAFTHEPEKTLALVAYEPEGNPIATVFSLGYNDWAYYVGAASYREYQKYLPNELLFWEYVRYWNSRSVRNLDLVGVRQYKMKYNPELLDQPVVYFERIKGIKQGKDFAKASVVFIREMRTKIDEKFKKLREITPRRHTDAQARNEDVINE